MERNALKDSPELVVASRAFSKNIEAQIDFRKRGDANFAHAAY
jgi:hypothetical protein